ncbi:amino acid adenylation domain-containing protein [Streptomyces sp. NPDC001889]
MSPQETAPAPAPGEAAIEDIGPLTSLQSGMLFHCLKAARPGPYLEQFVFRCARTGPGTGPVVDGRALGAAWRSVLARHSVLRTGFVWEEVDEPLQVTLSHAEVPVTETSLAGLPPREAERRVEEYLRADRAEGLDITRPPLMRIALLHASDATHLIWTVHHLVLDGWTMPRLLAEAGRAYREGPDSAREREPAPPFRDYADWLARQDTPAAERFWRESLGRRTPPARLVLRPGPPGERRGRVEGGTALHELPPAVGAAARAAARRARVSLSTWFQAAWAMTLSQAAPGPPQLFGVTVALRPAGLPGAQEITGPCVNTVPRRVDAGGAESVRDWLATIQRQQNATLPHQHLGLADIQRLCATEPEQPLFESIVAFENYPHHGSLLDLGPGTESTLWKYTEDTGYPLTLVVLPADGEIRLQLFHDTGRFAPEAVRTLLGRLEAAVGAMADGLDRPVREVRAATAAPAVAHGRPPAGDREDDGASDGSGGRDGDSPRAVTRLPLHRIVARQAARTPDAIAVDDHGTLLDYAALDDRSGRLAAELVRHGAGPDRVVALLLTRSATALVSILAVLRAGCAYLALDPDHPDERLRFLLADSGARVLLTEEATHHRAPGTEPVRLRADREPPAATPPDAAVGPDHLCYVTYTSGSTGRPKAVAMPHGPVVNMLAWELAHGTVPAPARTLAQVSFTFDVSAQEIFTTWAGGGTLVLAGDEDRRDFERLLRLARDQGIQRWYLSPTALEQIALAADRLGITLPELREVMVAGEPLRISDPVRALLAGARHGARLENQYGSSEVQVVSSHRLTGDPALLADRPPVGKAVDAVSLHVLGPDGRPVPYGVAGTVHIGGAALPRGYLGRPATTAERFVPDPFATVPGSRLYDTGDQGVLSWDGTLECLGRTDDQVKIRGYRIEPGEVRTALRALPGVRDAAVVIREIQGDHRLIGHVVHDTPDGGAWAEHERRLTAGLRAVLPPAFVPWRVVRVDRIPLTPSGKVDRRALPDPEPAARPASAPGHATRPAAALMDRLWTSVLGTAPAGPDDDFLALGGDSLLAIRLTSRVRGAFGVALGVGTLLAVRTPGALLAAVEEQLGGAGAADRAARRAGPPATP